MVTTTLSHDAVAKLAYEIWVKKGRVLGHDRENWREAEAQLRGGASARSNPNWLEAVKEGTQYKTGRPND